MKRILVTGAGGSAGINFIASLRMADEPLYIAGTDINAWHLQLPAVDSAFLMPHCSDPSYVNELCRLIEKERVGFVYAQPDMELEVISKNRDRLPARVFMPSHQAIVACHDKMETNERMAAAGVRVPRSRRIEKIEELDEILPGMLDESGVAWLRAIRGAGSKAALPVRSVRHAREWIHYWRSTGRLETSDFMLAEFLPGREYAFQSLWHDGKLVTSQARERLEYVFGNLFPSGQSSSPSVARTVHRKEVNEVATKAVQAVDPEPSGVYCVDMKEDRTGSPCVTEINIARFFTTSNFFAAAGSNMPYYYLRLAFGEELPDLPRYNAVPAGLYWIRLMDRGPVLVSGKEFRVPVKD
ncbi:MAG TPA: ATP-grasp domain-containing protein [Candidatus Saccharimonadales bacterium]|nr:ATP-grasp domain-containing protein [Candidatus Saccharimonadales bacterium]